MDHKLLKLNNIAATMVQLILRSVAISSSLDDSPVVSLTFASLISAGGFGLGGGGVGVGAGAGSGYSSVFFLLGSSTSFVSGSSFFSSFFAGSSLFSSFLSSFDVSVFFTL